MKAIKSGLILLLVLMVTRMAMAAATSDTVDYDET
jgi:hypothetical protein